MLLPLVGLVTICFKKKLSIKGHITLEIRQSVLGSSQLKLGRLKSPTTTILGIGEIRHFIENLGGSCNNIFKVRV